ncbi:MAG: gamma-glutamyl-phosphate reductase, partial [Pacificimonas sp.]
MTTDHDAMMTDLGKRARAVATQLSRATTEVKAAAVRAVASQIRERAAAILEANARDRKDNAELSDAMTDRLRLDEDRIEAIALAAESIADLPDPVGEPIKSWQQPNGLA